MDATPTATELATFRDEEEATTLVSATSSTKIHDWYGGRCGHLWAIDVLVEVLYSGKTDDACSMGGGRWTCNSRRRRPTSVLCIGEVAGRRAMYGGGDRWVCELPVCMDDAVWWPLLAMAPTTGKTNWRR